MDEKKFKLNLIVVLYEKKKAEKFFHNNYFIFKNSGVSLLIVDNGENKEYIPKDLNFFYIKTSQNTGYGKAVNLAFKYVESDYFLISNDDIIFEKNFFSKLLKKLNFYRENEFKLVGFNVFSNKSFKKGIQRKYYDYFVILYHFSFLPFFLSIFEKNNNGYVGVWEGIHFYKSSKEVYGVNGALMLVEKKSFEGVKMFDENYFLTYEETDLFIRFKKRNYKIYYDSSLKILHDHSISASKESTRYSFSSMDYFLKKNYGKKIGFLVKIYLKIFLFLKGLLKLKTE